MTNTVQLKRSNVANSVPSAGNLVPGELAINYTDGNLFYKNSSNIVTVIASNQFVSVTGNVTGNYFLGNANIQYTASTAPATGNLIGAQWYDTSTDTLYEWQTDGTSTYWVDITGPVIGSTGVATGSIIVNGTSNVTIPIANGNAGINIGGTANVAVFATTGEYVTGVVSATGNITGGNITTAGNVTGNYILGNGSQLTGIAATQLSGSMVGNITGANTYSINNLQDLTLNPTGSNITIGSIQASNFNNRWYFNTDMDLNGRLSAAGNVLGSNVIASGYISSTGNITGNNFSAGGILTTGGNANIAGNINLPTADANLTFGAVSVRNFNNRFYVNTDTDINGRLSAVGNVIGGNILTGGLVSATGNITGGNLNATGLSLSGNVVSAINTTANITTTANISGGNILGTHVGNVTGTTASLSGNITGGNLFTSGVVSATGNITATANISGGNILTVGIMSSTGNATHGNILATGTISATGATNNTGFAVGNSAVSNVALGYFPTAGTPAEMAIRDYSTVASTMYFDNSAGSANVQGSFRFRGSNAFTSWAVIDQYGINLPTRPAFRVYGNTSTNFTTGTTLTNQVIDYNQGSNYVNSTGIFTAPVAGLYSVWLNARAGSTASLSQIGVFKNNDTSGANVVCFWEITTSATTTTHFGVSSVTKLAAGDTLRAKVVAGGINFDNNDNWGAAYIG